MNPPQKDHSNFFAKPHPPPLPTPLNLQFVLEIVQLLLTHVHKFYCFYLGPHMFFKDYLCYKTITSENVPFEAQVKNFLFRDKLCSILKLFHFLYFQQSHDLPNLWHHDEY